VLAVPWAHAVTVVAKHNQLTRRRLLTRMTVDHFIPHSHLIL
jgi:hypothetical protein